MLRNVNAALLSLRGSMREVDSEHPLDWDTLVQNWKTPERHFKEHGTGYRPQTYETNGKQLIALHHMLKVVSPAIAILLSPEAMKLCTGLTKAQYVLNLPCFFQPIPIADHAHVETNT